MSSFRQWHVLRKRGFPHAACYVLPARRSVLALGYFWISSAFCVEGLFWISRHNLFLPPRTQGRAIDSLDGTILTWGRIPFS